MDMNQGRLAPALLATLTGLVVVSAALALGGLDADIQYSLPALAALAAAVVLPGCLGLAYNAWRSQRAQSAADNVAAMAVMEDVAPLEAESMSLADVHSLTAAHVERRQRERRAAERRAEGHADMLAS
jgi:hypothetical protein